MEATANLQTADPVRNPDHAAAPARRAFQETLAGQSMTRTTPGTPELREGESTPWSEAAEFVASLRQTLGKSLKEHADSAFASFLSSEAASDDEPAAELCHSPVPSSPRRTVVSPAMQLAAVSGTPGTSRRGHPATSGYTSFFSPAPGVGVTNPLRSQNEIVEQEMVSQELKDFCMYLCNALDNPESDPVESEPVWPPGPSDSLLPPNNALDKFAVIRSFLEIDLDSQIHATFEALERGETPKELFLGVFPGDEPVNVNHLHLDNKSQGQAQIQVQVHENENSDGENVNTHDHDQNFDGTDSFDQLRKCQQVFVECLDRDTANLQWHLPASSLARIDRSKRVRKETIGELLAYLPRTAFLEQQTLTSPPDYPAPPPPVLIESAEKHAKSPGHSKKTFFPSLLHKTRRSRAASIFDRDSGPKSRKSPPPVSPPPRPGSPPAVNRKAQGSGARSPSPPPKARPVTLFGRMPEHDPSALLSQPPAGVDISEAEWSKEVSALGEENAVLWVKRLQQSAERERLVPGMWGMKQQYWKNIDRKDLRKLQQLSKDLKAKVSELEASQKETQLEKQYLQASISGQWAEFRSWRCHTLSTDFVKFAHHAIEVKDALSTCTSIRTQILFMLIEDLEEGLCALKAATSQSFSGHLPSLNTLELVHSLPTLVALQENLARLQSTENVLARSFLSQRCLASIQSEDQRCQRMRSLIFPPGEEDQTSDFIYFAECWTQQLAFDDLLLDERWLPGRQLAHFANTLAREANISPIDVVDFIESFVESAALHFRVEKTARLALFTHRAIMSKVYRYCWPSPATNSYGEQWKAFRGNQLALRSKDPAEVDPALAQFVGQIRFDRAIETLEGMIFTLVPVDMIACINDAIKLLSEAAQTVMGAPPSADDLFPLMLYCLLLADIPFVHQHFDYMEQYASFDQKMGMFGYALTTFQASMSVLTDNPPQSSSSSTTAASISSPSSPPSSSHSSTELAQVQ